MYLHLLHVRNLTPYNGSWLTSALSNACNNKAYTETWEGWESPANSPPWTKAAYTDKQFQGWWCLEKY
jgi:hypothetical protein